METTPPGKSAGREIVERTVEAALGSIPLAGNALAVTFVTAIGWRLEQRREKWFTELAEGVEELRQRVDGLDFDTLTGDDRFTDAAVSATRAIEHTHQVEKIEALRNAVLNSAVPGAPDADTQAIMMNLIDRFTPSHLRVLALWNNPPAWFESNEIPQPAEASSFGAAIPTSRTVTVEAGLPELRGRKDFYLLIASELIAARLMVDVNLGISVTSRALMDQLTTDFGRQFLTFIRPPNASGRSGPCS